MTPAPVSARLLICALVVVSCAPPVAASQAVPSWRTASPGTLKIVGPRSETTPVVNEGGTLALRVVDASGNDVAVRSWSSDNKSVGKVNRRGLLRGRAFGFAAVTAQTDRGPVSGFVVCARVRRQTGAMARGDTKADTSGNVYLSSPQQHVVYRSDGLSAGVFAGSAGQAGYVEATGASARFDGPAGLGVDNRAEGGIYVADTANACIRKIDFRGRSSLAVGTPGVAGTMYGDENAIGEAVFDTPSGVASVGTNLFVTDSGNHCIWYVDVQRRRVDLVAGEPGEAGLTSGQGRAARLNRPTGIAINTRQNLLAVADTGNHVIRLVGITPRQGGGVVGTVTTLGLASSAQSADILAKLGDDRGSDQISFDAPVSVSFDGVDNVYVIDRQTASVVTRPPAASGRPVERVELAQFGTLGDPASVTVRRTQAFVLDESAEAEATAVSVVEVGAPTIARVSPDFDRLEGGQTVRIEGSNFAPESLVTLGDALVTNLRVLSSRQIEFSAPAQGAPGTRTLTVVTRGGVAQAPFSIRAKSLDELAPGEITTVVGGVRYAGDGGTVMAATLDQPHDAAVDAAGNLLVADTDHHRVRRIEASTGRIITLAGTGVYGFNGDLQPATGAKISYPSGVTVDEGGNIFIADSFNNRVRRIEATTGQITTVAGTGGAFFNGDNRLATSATLSSPSGISIDVAGNLYIADSGHHRIRRVDASTGIITTVAGTGERGYGGDGGLATGAKLANPRKVVVDSVGNLFIVDTRNHRVRRVDSGTGTITTVAGTGEPGFNGDGQLATGAQLNTPSDVAIGTDGGLLIADATNHRVRRVDSVTAQITTVAGTGEAGFAGDGGDAANAKLARPLGVAVDAFGSIIIIDSDNSRIRSVDASTSRITSVVGVDETNVGDGRSATGANILNPLRAIADSDGNLYVVDTAHNRVRRVDRATGLISTVAGTGAGGFGGDRGPAAKAQLSAPVDIALDSAGNLYIADTGNNRVRKVDKSSRRISTVAGTGDGAYDGDNKPATAAALSTPSGVLIGPEGDIFISEEARVRRVIADTGLIVTVAGTGEVGFDGDDKPATSASLSSPSGLAMDSSRNLYIADTSNYRVRRVDATTGTITTVAGTGGFDGGDDGELATEARIITPRGVAIDPVGNLYVADTGSSRVRRVDRMTGIITTVAGTGEFGYAGDNGPAILATVVEPVGIALDTAGNLLIGDRESSSIRAVKAVTESAANRVPTARTAIAVGMYSREESVRLVRPSESSSRIDERNARVSMRRPVAVYVPSRVMKFTCPGTLPLSRRYRLTRVAGTRYARVTATGSTGRSRYRLSSVRRGAAEIRSTTSIPLITRPKIV